MRRVKWLLRSASQAVFPKFTLAVLAHRTWVLEPEVALVPFLSRRKGLAVDAGTNKGVYLYHLSRHFRRVAGFEPLPSLATYLEKAAPKNANVRRMALSNAAGTATLSLPRGYNELGSLEAHTAETWTAAAPIEHHEVKLETLDSLGLTEVALLKIDVEGHELPVIEGANKTIELWRPTIMVEVEERHRAGGVERIQNHLEARGYRGYFLDGLKLRPMAEFDLKRDQNIESLAHSVKVSRYINNFLFFYASDAAERVAVIEAALSNRHKLELGAALAPGHTVTARERLTGTWRAARDMLRPAATAAAT